MLLNEKVNIFNLLLEKVSQRKIIDKIIPAISHLEYAIIGGGAVSFYSKLARTISPEDFDLAIIPLQKKEIVNILIGIGLDLEKEHEFMGNYWLVFKYINQDIDVALALDSLFIWGIENAETFNYFGNTVKVINQNALICNKLIAGRNKDYRDITYLLKNYKKEDYKLLEKIAKRFVPEYLEDLEQLKEDSLMTDDMLNNFYLS